MEVEGHKKRFIGGELALLTIQASLSTRNKNYPIYKNHIKNDRKILGTAIRQILNEVEEKYKREISQEEHVQYIKDVTDSLTRRFSEYLYNEKFRFGIAQKLINLYLKYLWCAGRIDEPPNCPIDGIIRDRAQLGYNWIISDDVMEYKNAIEILTAKAKEDGKTIAQWELINFSRRK